MLTINLRKKTGNLRYQKSTTSKTSDKFVRISRKTKSKKKSRLTFNLESRKKVAMVGEPIQQKG